MMVGHSRVCGPFCSDGGIPGDHRPLIVFRGMRCRGMSLVTVLFAFRVSEQASALVDTILRDGKEIVAWKHMAFDEVFFPPLKGLEFVGTGLDEASVL